MKEEQKLPAIEDLPPTVREATMSLTSWVALEAFPKKIIDQEFLALAYDLGCGIIMPPNFNAVDAIIPIKLADLSYGYNSCQFKLHEGTHISQHLRSAAKMNSAIKGIKPALKIFMDVGPLDLNNQPQPRDKTITSLRNFLKSGVMLYGLAPYSFLGRDMVKAIETLRRHQIDRIQAAERAVILKIMNPVGCYYVEEKEKREQESPNMPPTPVNEVLMDVDTQEQGEDLGGSDYSDDSDDGSSDEDFTAMEE